MKPADFEYHAPRTLDALLALLAEHREEGKILAGGQSLVPVMNFRLARPPRLFDLNGIAELDFLEVDKQEFGIFTGDNDLTRIYGLRFESHLPHVARENWDDQPFPERTDQVARARTHLAQKGDTCEYFLNLFPNGAMCILQFVNDAAILEQLVDGPIMPAPDFPKFVVPLLCLARDGGLACLQ